MTQDFARRRRQQAKKKPRYQTNVPGWVWLFTGSVLGAFVMFLVYLAGIPPQPGSENSSLFSGTIFSGDKTRPEQGDPPPVVISEPIAGAASDESKKKVEITFYERLKEYEIIPTEKPLDREEVTRRKNYSCSLQVASFPTAEDADRARAELILLNLEPHIEAGTTRSQQPVFRVKIGPFNSKAKLDAVRPALYDNGYDDHFPICAKN